MHRINSSPHMTTRISKAILAIGLCCVSLMVGTLMAQQPSNQSAQRWWVLRAPRDQAPSQIGKNHDLVKTAFQSITKQANKATVRVFSGERQVALGTVFAADGYILTKASQLEKSIRCLVPGHSQQSAKIVATNDQLDLAILKIKRNSLNVADLSSRTIPAQGSWLAAVGGFGQRPLVVGIATAKARPVRRESGMLGIVIEDTSSGVMVGEVKDNSAAAAAKLKTGDVIQTVNETPIRGRTQLIGMIRQMRPGDRIRLAIRRGEEDITKTASLSRAREIFNAHDRIFANAGGALSQRRSDFPTVIQHDCLLQPNQCGGPMVTSDGAIIGINIARAGRIKSYTLPNSAFLSWANRAVATHRNSQPITSL